MKRAGLVGKSLSGRIDMPFYPIHGKTKSRVHAAWKAMNQRCFNKRCREYRYYGERGITVCERWRRFEAFFEDMGDPPDGMSLDRIDNNRGYGPGNCRWATKGEQSNNRRSCKLIEFRGNAQNQKQWAREMGIHQTTIAGRLRNGWSVERALTQVPENRGQANRCKRS